MAEIAIRFIDHAPSWLFVTAAAIYLYLGYQWREPEPDKANEHSVLVAIATVCFFTAALIVGVDALTQLTTQ